MNYSDISPQTAAVGNIRLCCKVILRLFVHCGIIRQLFDIYAKFGVPSNSLPDADDQGPGATR